MKIESKELILKCFYVAAFVLIFFIMTGVILLFVRNLEMNAADPLEMVVIEELKHQAKGELQNQKLRNQIRELDLVTRREWFGRLSFSRKLKKMLGLALAALIIIIATIERLKPRVVSLENLGRKKSGPAIESWALLFTAIFSIVAVNGFLLLSKPANQKKLPDQAANKSKEEIVETFSLKHEELKKYWPGFRGIYNDGISTLHRAVTGWGDDEFPSVKWRSEVPLPGYSSPIVVKDLIFVTGGDKNERTLFCFDDETGEMLWKHSASKISGSPAIPPEVSDDTGYAAATPVTNGKAVFAIFATGDLISTDFNGKRLWAKNLDVPENIYGYSSSLLAYNDYLIVQYDNDNKKILYCIDAQNGNAIWEKERSTSVSWSSPTLCSVDDKKLVVLVTCSDAQAFNLETGEMVWSHAIMGGEVAPSVTCDDQTVYVANEYVVAAAIDAATGELKWKNDRPILPDVSSPVVYNNMLFLFTSAATIGCLDAATGKILWEKDVENGFYSSPLALKDRIIIFDLKGKMLVIKPDRKDLVIDKTEALNQPVLTTPAIGKNKMWLRISGEILKIEGKQND